MTPKIAIVGAGVGGLVAAITLARQGFSVTVFERQSGPGGKMRVVETAGAMVDAGPTVLTMRWVFDEIFEAAGTSLEKELALEQATILARHTWQKGDRFDLMADRQTSADAIAAFSGPDEARRYLAFCARAAEIFQTLDHSFMRHPDPSVASLMRGVGIGGLGRLANIKPFATLWSALGTYFHDPRLRQLFARYSTYCGASPFEAPATLMLIAHVEQEGVWLVEGGMHALAGALRSLAERHGVKFRFEADITRIEVKNRSVRAVHTREGDRFACDALMLNSDAQALAEGLFGEAARKAVRISGRRSLSALTWCVKARTRGFPLRHHNVFFSSDYAREFQEIFEQNRLPLEPTIYVCAQDRGNLEQDVNGAERLFILVNAPATGDGSEIGEADIDACEARTFARLRHLGLEIDPDAPPVLTGPREFNALFPATGGALYGRASHGWRASFERPGLRSSIQGLYLAGGSVHPGPGVPMAALSGRMAAACLISDRHSTGLSRRTVMLGGTSTR